MGSHNDFDAILGRYELTKGLKTGTRWVAHDQSCGKMDYLYPIPLHLGWSILHITARTPSAGGVAHQLYLLVMIEREGPFSIAQCTKAFAAGARAISVADDDADPDHVYSVPPFPQDLTVRIVPHYM
jgi:hypothetical protein